MKDTLKNKTKAILLTVLSVLLCSVFSLLSFSAEDDFESKIAAFPESYKPYLRQLHTAHPNWEFEPFFTTLDFNTAVDNECGTKSLVSSSASSKIFKSKDIGDYNYTTGSYIQKDSGFVEANRLAVAYFMDPRNFLNADGIFMFETLSFNEAFTTSVIENILKGSFMYNTKISYLDSEGKKIETSTKYSKAIYDAGKKYNVNPCFLASKILNEVGTSGSKSVTGDYSTYPGIYNFYNIGATDGSGAIGRGLKWASTGTTYSRPWTTPVKSIEGGAEYLAESYIACGQFTGYLQRFNVNPNNTKHPVYTHQYMTNLTGALSQGYSTYTSYVSSGLLDNKYVFSIPVYENMPSSASTSLSGRFADSVGQTGTISASTSFVRTGPSTYHAKLYDNKGAEIKLTAGVAVTILDKVDTDTNYYLSVLQYPYWCKISFVYNGVTYQGYVPENFVDINTKITVGTGTFTPAIAVSDSSVCMKLISYDANIAKITDNNTINFLKEGTVSIAAYDSVGNFDKVEYTVSKSAVTAQPKVSLSGVTPSTAVVNFTAIPDAKGYNIVVIDNSGKIIHSATVTSASPYKITGLYGAADYNVCVRAILGSGSADVYGPFGSSFLNTLPDSAEITRVSKDSTGKITIHWNKLNGISGYYAYTYDSATRTYKYIGTLSPGATSYTIPTSYVSKNCFALRAFEVVGESTVSGSYSKIVDIRNIPAGCTGVNVSSVTDDGYTITWNAVDGAKYNLYKLNGSTYELYKSVSSPTYKVKNAGLSSYAKYKVCAFKRVSDIVYESVPTSEFSAATTPAAVTNLKVTPSAVGGKFTWKAVDNTTCYVIYIYKESSGKYVKKTTVKTNSYTMTDKSPGRQYKIRIKACIKTTFGNYYGEYDSVSFYTTPEKVTDVKFTSVDTDSFKMSWEKTGGTSKYYIYQYDSKKKKYIRIKETTGTSHSVSGLKSGTAYKFKIRSIKLINGKTVSKVTSSVITAATKPGKVTSVKAKRSKTALRLIWPEVNGATNYQIYMYDSEKEKYVRITSVDEVTEYRISGLKAGKTYKFKIRPFKTVNGKNYFGAYSDVYSFKTKS